MIGNCCVFLPLRVPRVEILLYFMYLIHQFIINIVPFNEPHDFATQLIQLLIVSMKHERLNAMVDFIVEC